MYINTFKYTPADVDCKLCTEYVKKFGCTACGCPWMAERIEAGVVGYFFHLDDELRLHCIHFHKEACQKNTLTGFSAREVAQWRE